MAEPPSHLKEPKNIINILLTFTGFHDPFSPGLIAGQEEEGPILSLARERSFNQIVLFSTPNTIDLTEQTSRCLKDRFSGLKVSIRHLPLEDPTNYVEILKGLRYVYSEIAQENIEARYLISVTSGTPQMHACWLLLVASGEIPGTILNVRPKRFASPERPLITEVRLDQPTFPEIRPKREFDIKSQSSGGPEDKMRAALENEDIIGSHPGFLSAVETATALAHSDVPILILGESGTGKELFAGLIHRLSDRSAGPFVAINCAAIPNQLAESFLFGHRRGAFTGAVKDQIGKFDASNGGTLFLDELAELELEIQAKLLRVLQDGMVEPLGEEKGHKVNVRLIAATNRDVGLAISEGTFRRDLYYRLNIGEIRLPSLRERRSDIPILALYFLDELNRRLKIPKTFSPDALAFLQGQEWPGNIRELRNIIHRAVLISRERIISPEDLKPVQKGVQGSVLDLLPEPYPGFSVDQMMSDIRKQMFDKALQKTKGNQSEAARLLGLSPQAVSKYLKEKDLK